MLSNKLIINKLKYSACINKADSLLRLISYVWSYNRVVKYKLLTIFYLSRVCAQRGFRHAYNSRQTLYIVSRLTRAYYYTLKLFNSSKSYLIDLVSIILLLLLVVPYSRSYLFSNLFLQYRLSLLELLLLRLAQQSKAYLRNLIYSASVGGLPLQLALLLLGIYLILLQLLYARFFLMSFYYSSVQLKQFIYFI